MQIEKNQLRQTQFILRTTANKNACHRRLHLQTIGMRNPSNSVALAIMVLRPCVLSLKQGKSTLCTQQPRTAIRTRPSVDTHNQSPQPSIKNQMHIYRLIHAHKELVHSRTTEPAYHELSEMQTQVMSGVQESRLAAFDFLQEKACTTKLRSALHRRMLPYHNNLYFQKCCLCYCLHPLKYCRLFPNATAPSLHRNILLNQIRPSSLQQSKKE